MNPELDRLLERMRQRREQRAGELAGAAPVRAAGGGVRGQAHPLGTKVFDTVTGQEGTVVGGGSENVVVSTPE